MDRRHLGRTKSQDTKTHPLKIRVIEGSNNVQLLTTTSTTTTTEEEAETTARRSIGVLGSLEWEALTPALHKMCSHRLRKVRLASHREWPPGYQKSAARNLSRT
jgi:hypothetical protein